MPKRITLLLDDRVYEKLVKESICRYGNARNLSKIVNDLVEQRTGKRANILKLIYSKKIKKTSANEFESFRRNLSARFEN